MKDVFESKYKYHSSKSTPHLLVPQQHCGSVVLETEQMDMISWIISKICIQYFPDLLQNAVLIRSS